MQEYLTDQELGTLIAEPKPLPEDYQRRLTAKPKRGHREVELELSGDQGSEFRLLIRQSNFTPLDFSVILAYCLPPSTAVVRLRRYNGKSHEHTNSLEGETFYDFHIHKATERYQRSGNREDAYAEKSDRFSNLQEAIDCMIQDCAFHVPPGAKLPLFAPRE